MASSLTRWQVAFAQQAKSDYDAYAHLCENGELPECHRLHYLQMCLEKLAKAHLYSSRGKPPTNIQTSHSFVAKVLPQVNREYRHRTHGLELDQNRLAAIKNLCKEIDRLAPANDDGNRRPDNCEYPWELSGFRLSNKASAGKIAVCVPAMHVFAVSQTIQSRLGIGFLKIMLAIMTDYATEPKP
jgi:hypothetical protein